MNHRKYLFTLLFLIFLLPSGYSQYYEFYDISISVANPPGWGYQSEWYMKENGRAVHKTSKMEYDLKHSTTEQTFREELPESQINLFDSLYRLQEFKFKVKKSVITAMKKNAHWYNFHDSDFQDFIGEGDTVMLRIRDIPKDSALKFTLDGSPFTITYKVKKHDQDTVQFSINGNFAAGRVKNDEIQNWLAVYLFYRQNRIFSSIKNMDAYYGNKKLEDVLLRFMAWTKK